MPSIGTKITCSETGKVGEFISRSAGGFTCRDKAGNYFLVRKAVRGVLKCKAKVKPWQPDFDGGEVNPELSELASRVKAQRAAQSAGG